MSQERPEERFAFAVVARVLAVTVESYDVRGRQGAVDAILHYPDGRTAALEVTSIGPDTEAGIISYLGARGYCKSVAGVTRKWIVQVPRNFHPADMRKIEKVLPRCEASGAENLSELTGGDQDVDYLLSQGVRAASAASGPGAAGSRVYFVLPAIGGFSGPGMASLPDELARVLRIPTTQSKISKLAATGLKERHLFLVVRPSAFSWPVYDGLAFGGPLPTEAPSLLGNVSQIWLVTAFERAELFAVFRAAGGSGITRTTNQTPLRFDHKCDGPDRPRCAPEMWPTLRPRPASSSRSRRSAHAAPHL